MKVLVTGAAGFTGMQMIKFLVPQKGVKPVGLVHRQIPKNHLRPDPFVVADLLDRTKLHAEVAKISPDAIIHLGGLTHGTAEDLHMTNVTGTKNLLDASLAANPDCRILVISSSGVYGYAGDLPISETAPLRPVSDYGRSKVAQETLCMNYDEDDAAITIARPFNLAGPHQSEAFVCGRIVGQIIEIEQKKRTAIELREIVSSRDLIDVRDVVRGYWALVSHPDFTSDCSKKAFNLGSGNAYAVSAIIALIEEITGDHYQIQLPETSPPVPIPSQRSDNTRITELTGWRPEITLKDTLWDMLTAAREKQ